MKKVVFIISLPYSGSTVLARTLAIKHQNVTTIGERDKFWKKLIAPAYDVNKDKFGDSVTGMVVDSTFGVSDSMELQRMTYRLCSCGKLLQNCEIWKEIRKIIFPQLPTSVRHVNFTQFIYHKNKYINSLFHKVIRYYARKGRLDCLPPIIRGRFQLIRDMNVKLIEAILRVNNCNVLVDTSKHFLYPLYIETSSEIATYCIHLVRDGRAQAISQLKWRADKINTLEAAAINWRNMLSRQLTYLACLQSPLMQVRYEEFCKKPEQVLDEIYNFCGLETAEKRSEKESVLHFFGNAGVRFSTNQKIHCREEWKSQYDSEKLDLFNDIAGSLNQSLGYVGNPLSDLVIEDGDREQ